LIRAHLRYFNVDKELRTLMVASAAPGDGKTTVARHLAGAAARMGSRVLLLEADLRRPTIAVQLDVASGPGVADVLIGVVDTPPLTAVSDAFPLLSKVDGVIIVGRVGRNRRDVAQRLHETLTGAGAPLLGVVANGFKSGRLGGYGYGYSYDYAAGGGKAPSPDGGAPAGGVSPNGAGASEEPVPTSQA
jgi:polysaccharide biosynthesis transport protein